MEPQTKLMRAYLRRTLTIPELKSLKRELQSFALRQGRAIERRSIDTLTRSYIMYYASLFDDIGAVRKEIQLRTRRRKPRTHKRKQ